MLKQLLLLPLLAFVAVISTRNECFDVQEGCNQDSEFCNAMTFNGALVRIRCQKTCGLCHCNNFARNCLALLSKCSRSGRVRRRCALTCNACTTECTDIDGEEDDAYNCARHSYKCATSALFRKRCARTCGLC